jgi:hypothetical protein
LEVVVESAVRRVGTFETGGALYAGPFTNWVQQDYSISTFATSPITFTLGNSSYTSLGDWLGLDWIELHLVQSGSPADRARAAVPEPSALALGASGVLVLFGSVCRRHQRAAASVKEPATELLPIDETHRPRWPGRG